MRRRGGSPGSYLWVRGKLVRGESWRAWCSSILYVGKRLHLVSNQSPARATRCCRPEGAHSSPPLVQGRPGRPGRQAAEADHHSGRCPGRSPSPPPSRFDPPKGTARTAQTLNCHPREDGPGTRLPRCAIDLPLPGGQQQGRKEGTSPATLSTASPPSTGCRRSRRRKSAST